MSKFELYGTKGAGTPYANPMPGQQLTATGVTFRPHEEPINRAVSQLGQSDNEWLRAAIIYAIAPQLGPVDLIDDRVPYIVESGCDVDWIVVDIDPETTEETVLAITEHKPLSAPVQFSRAFTEIFYDPNVPLEIAEGYLEEMEPFREILDSGCFTQEELDAVDGYLRFYEGSYINRDKTQQFLSLPQVLVYWHRHQMPCQILTDITTSAQQLYYAKPRNGFERPYQLVDEMFPTHTTAQTLNELAARLYGVALTEDEHAEVTRVVDAMWMRGPVDIDDHLTKSAQQLVSQAARWASYNASDPDLIFVKK